MDLHLLTLYEFSLEFLLSPLPNKPSVHIVGAGISGLAAASILKHLTPNLVVSEARDRLGGRI